jgi:phosphonate transport system substrate-binding protein
MGHRLNQRVMIATFIIFYLIGAGHAAETNKSYKFAILPCNNIEITFKKFYPLISYLKKATGLDMALVVPANFAEYENALKKGGLDFVLQEPHTYILLSDFFDKAGLLRTITIAGAPTLSGVVIVRQDSQIRNIQDLKGKTVMFGPKSSTTKWFAARLLFEKNGLNIDTDLKSYAHGGCCEDIAFAVYLKSTDAGVVCDHFLEEHEEKQKDLGVEASKIMVIGQTIPVPTRIFAARRGLEEGIVAQVNQALLKLDRNNPEHARILLRGEIGGFQGAKDEDYNAMRKLMKAEQANK